MVDEELNIINQYSNGCMNRGMINVHYAKDELQLNTDCNPAVNISILGCSEPSNKTTILYLLKPNLTRNTIAHELYHAYQYNCHKHFEPNLFVVEGTASLYANMRNPENCTGYFFKCWLINSGLTQDQQSQLLSDMRDVDVTLEWLAERSNYSISYLTKG